MVKVHWYSKELQDAHERGEPVVINTTPPTETGQSVFWNNNPFNPTGFYLEGIGKLIKIDDLWVHKDGSEFRMTNENGKPIFVKVSP